MLSVREASDGTVLVHCFHGCSAAEVMKAVGLELSDLFPKFDAALRVHTTRRRRGSVAAGQASHRVPQVDWAALISACEKDLLTTAIVLEQLANSQDICAD